MSPPAIRTYERHVCVVFRKTNEEFGGLSNMAPGFPLRVNGIFIRTSEALYQACRFPHMPDIQRLILEQTSPMTAKMKSKPYRSQSRSDWDRVRVKVMTWCLRIKLAQNWRSFGELLLDTGRLPIVEESAKDDFWGAKPVGTDSLTGKNVLGRLLMKLREDLRGPHPEFLRHVKPLPIPDFSLLGQPIVTIDTRSTHRVDQDSKLSRDGGAEALVAGRSPSQGDWLSPRKVPLIVTADVGTASPPSASSPEAFVRGEGSSLLVVTQIPDEAAQSVPLSLGSLIPTYLSTLPSEVLISGSIDPSDTHQLDEFLRRLRERLTSLGPEQKRLELVVFKTK